MEERTTSFVRDPRRLQMQEPAPRMFWPEEVWSKHASELAAFKVGFENRLVMVSGMFRARTQSPVQSTFIGSAGRRLNPRHKQWLHA